MSSFPSPVVNQVPISQRPSVDWAKVSSIEAPFGRADSKTFGFWFNYFWAEAIKNPATTPAQKAKLCEAYSNVFQPDGAVRPDFAGKSNIAKEGILRSILMVGFRRVEITSMVPAPSTNQTDFTRMASVHNSLPLKGSNAADLRLEMVLGTGNIHRPIAYRADSRSYEALTNGFKARARSYNDPIYAKYGLDQAWHPYNNVLFRNSIWLRLGTTNRDNCLHTVISVGPSFAGITHFPILNDINNFGAKSATKSHTREVQFLAFKPFDEWTPADIAAAAKDFQKVRAELLNGKVEYLEKTNYIHVFHLTGIVGFDTESYFTGADKFPERGVSEVPRSHFLAELKFYQRYWYNPSERQIKLFEIKFEPIRWVPDQSTVDHVLGESGRLRLLALIQAQIDSAESQPDPVSELGLYNGWKATRDTYLTGAEKNNIIAGIKRYLDEAKPKIPSGARERTAVKGFHPELAAKIDTISVEDWGRYKKISALPL